MSKPDLKATLLRALACIARTRIILSLTFSLAFAALALHLPVCIGHAVDLVSINSPAFPSILARISIIAGLMILCQWTLLLCIHHPFTDLRQNAFARIQHLPLGCLEPPFSDDLVHCVTSDADIIDSDLLTECIQILIATLISLGSLIFMLRISMGAAAAVALIAPLSLFAKPLFSQRIAAFSNAHNSPRDEQTAQINEALLNLKSAQAFSSKDAALQRFSTCSAQLANASATAAFLASLPNLAARFMDYLVCVSAAILCALSAVTSGMNAGQFISFLAFAALYSRSFNTIPTVVSALPNALNSTARIFALIDTPTEEPDPQSTLTPDIISLEPWLKAGTICENIALSRPDATREAIIAAAKAAHAHSFIRRMPGGYDAIIGENGSGLSEEQKQLLCDARAMLHH